jgi:hypothetical protein
MADDLKTEIDKASYLGSRLVFRNLPTDYSPDDIKSLIESKGIGKIYRKH